MAPGALALLSPPPLAIDYAHRAVIEIVAVARRRKHLHGPLPGNGYQESKHVRDNGTDVLDIANMRIELPQLFVSECAGSGMLHPL